MALGHKNPMYKFDKARHYHSFDGKPLMGVTTVLSVIAKPALIQWSANMAVDYVQSHVVIGHYNVASKVGSIEFDEGFDDILLKARTAHKMKKEKAGDWGTIMHEAIEYWVKEQREPTNLDEKGQEVFEKFKVWVTENNVKFLTNEKNVWSEELWLGGICDVVIEMNGKKYIGDFKTSSGIYNEAFFQIAAYHLMLIEMGLYTNDDIEGYIVINLKKDGTMDTKIAMDKELNQEAFKSALNLYKIIKSLN